ncbi:aromatic-L-amino-acid decarboxylase-like [Oscarella lobularis]|uniref:aromatic-L-amino-acid decarboxylase-like n=1 Tax=Oscarella lobularis TaxID=121494 RepID=UPI0033132B66
MDSDEFRRRGKEMIDAIADYHDSIRDRPPLANVNPGYLRDLLPRAAPEQPEQWDDLVKDIERTIMPGITHWHHPQFHAYYPTGFSYPSLLGEMLCQAIGCIGFSWIASPASTELEIIVLDWLGKALGLPEAFLTSDASGKPQHGGGVIQGTASETLLVGVLAARTRSVKKLQEKNPSLSVQQAMDKLVAYASDHVHSAFQKGGSLAGVRTRTLPTDDEFSLRGDSLKQAIEEDIKAGFVPCFVCATLGTTSFCSFDNLTEIGPICQENDVWLHVDAAYAGSALICPEFRHFANGAEFADSFNFNAHKWFLTNFDCSCMWVKNRAALITAMSPTATPAFLQNAASETGLVIDYMHWQVPLGRRFRSLKLWFVLRLFGITGIQNHIRKHVELAKRFESYIVNDDRFQIVAKRHLGLVCFQLKGDDELNRELLKQLNASGKLHLVSTELEGKTVLRVAICSAQTEEKDIDFSWQLISQTAKDVLSGDEEEPSKISGSD